MKAQIVPELLLHNITIPIESLHDLNEIMSSDLMKAAVTGTQNET